MANATITAPAHSHTAYHGNTFNPNTGEIMEYGALSQSTDGPLWQSANTGEIHQLAQGNSTTIHGTNTMFFIPVTAIPKGKGNLLVHCVCVHTAWKNSPPLHTLDCRR